MIVVIVGPTGVGKTAVSLEIAKHYQTDIISGDAVQVYRQLNIGSAKITAEEMQGISHHMIDILDPKEPFSVALYQKHVRAIINTMIAQGKLPLLVGGTGFYIKSVLHDFNFTNTKRNHDFETENENIDNQTLHDRLKAIDPQTASNIHPNNRKRLLHALSRAQTNNPLSAETNHQKALYPYIMVGLRKDRKKLYEIINQRVLKMIESGLIEEAKSLFDQNIRGTSTEAIGYKELYGYFDGEYDLDEAIRLIQRNSRRYAKRQMTYLNHQFNVQWIDVDQKTILEVANEAVKHIEKAMH